MGDPLPNPWLRLVFLLSPIEGSRANGVYSYMARRACLSAVVVLSAMAFGCTPGLAANQSVTATVASLISASKQRVDKLFVRASMNEVGTLTAAGTVAVPAGAAKLYRFKSVSKAVSANVPVKLPLKLSKKSLKVVKAALRRRK